MGGHQFGSLVAFGTTGIPIPIMVHPETERHKIKMGIRVAEWTVQVAGGGVSASVALAVKMELCGSENSCVEESQGSRVKARLELGRNEKVLITTLMPACQSPAGLSRPAGLATADWSEDGRASRSFAAPRGRKNCH